MIDLAGRILKASLQVLWFQIRELLKNLVTRQSPGEKIEHIGDTHPHAPNARTPPTLV
jgi:hypothetical protein